MLERSVVIRSTKEKENVHLILSEKANKVFSVLILSC